MKLADKVALVTGGSSGIGRASALALAQAGARVVICDINDAGGEETVARIQQAGGVGVYIHADVSRADQVKALVQRTVDSFGRLDCAVNNAGIVGDLVPTDRRSEETWDAIIDVNLKGVWLCMKYEIPVMLANGSGSIINMASAAGLIGFKNGSAYAASKHGIVGLTRSAAIEYATKGLRINVICPGFTETPMVEQIRTTNPRVAEATVNTIPMKRLGMPEEIAQAVLWLCSDDSSFVNGHTLAVDGGMVA